MNELKTLLNALSPLERHQLLLRACGFYLRRHPRLVPLLATVFTGPPVFFFGCR